MFFTACSVIKNFRHHFFQLEIYLTSLKTNYYRLPNNISDDLEFTIYLALCG